MLIRVIRNHGKLIACGLLALVLFFFLPAAWRAATRALIGWDIAIAIYLVLAFIAMSNFDLKRVRSRAADQDEGALLILLLATMAVIASLVAIVMLLGEVRTSGGESQASYFSLCRLLQILYYLYLHSYQPYQYLQDYY
jgi:uncharacterized membrane protein